MKSLGGNEEEKNAWVVLPKWNPRPSPTPNDQAFGQRTRPGRLEAFGASSGAVGGRRAARGPEAAFEGEALGGRLHIRGLDLMGLMVYGRFEVDCIGWFRYFRVLGLESRTSEFGGWVQRGAEPRNAPPACVSAARGCPPPSACPPHPPRRGSSHHARRAAKTMPQCDGSLTRNRANMAHT